jgi:hypothetical protein
MPKRKKPDDEIESTLDDMFAPVAPERESAEAQKRQTENAAEPDADPESSAPGMELLNPSPEEEKERIHGPYVPESLSFKLQEVQLRLRQLTGETVTKSEVMEAALRLALSDFERKEAESGLARLVERIREAG